MDTTKSKVISKLDEAKSEELLTQMNKVVEETRQARLARSSSNRTEVKFSLLYGLISYKKSYDNSEG